MNETYIGRIMCWLVLGGNGGVTKGGPVCWLVVAGSGEARMRGELKDIVEG